jgi:hypothetical protein
MIWHTVKKYARSAGLQVDRLDERGICAHSTRVTAITASFEGGAKLARKSSSSWATRTRGIHYG